MNGPFPSTRGEKLEWLHKFKGLLYVRELEHLSDEEVDQRFRAAYTEYLRLEEAADELLL